MSIYNWQKSGWEQELYRKNGVEPEFAQVGELVMNKTLPEWKAKAEKMGMVFFPNLSVGWDTNARYVKADTRPIIRNSNPRDFETYARKIRDWADRNIPANMPKLITVNSWNEWTEGGYLEPDSMFGYGYLDALRKVFVEAGQQCGDSALAVATSKSTLKNKLNTLCQYSLRHVRVESTPIRVALARALAGGFAVAFDVLPSASLRRIPAPQKISAVGSFFHTPRAKM